MVNNKFGLSSLITGLLAFVPMLLFILITLTEPLIGPLNPTSAGVLVIVFIILGFIFAALAIIFGIVGAIAEQRKIMSVLGIILGFVAIVCMVAFVFIAIFLPYLLAVTLIAACAGICEASAQGGGV